MPRTDGWRRRVSSAALVAVLLLAPLGVVGHVHATDAAASAACLVCTAADHGAAAAPVVACQVPAPTSAREPIRPAARPVVGRSVVTFPSRGPPALGTSPSH